jgi:hypothetical protein
MHSRKGKVMSWDEKVKLLKPEEYCPANCPYRKTTRYPVTFKHCGEKPLLQRGRRYLRREDCQLKKEGKYG